MNPYPLDSLKNFTVPVIKINIKIKKLRYESMIFWADLLKEKVKFDQNY